MPGSSDLLSPRSVQRAFVVQFRADTHIASGRITGRVEHIPSRAATTFDSLETLLSFIHQVMRRTCSTTGHAEWNDDEGAADARS